MENPDNVLLWRKLNAWAMSDEESDDENGKIFRTVPRQSDEATDLLNRIDMALGFLSGSMVIHQNVVLTTNIRNF